MNTSSSYEQFVRACDKNPSLTREQVAKRLKLGHWQAIAFAARMAAARGETTPPRGRVEESSHRDESV